jgi:hypothetical protein
VQRRSNRTKKPSQLKGKGTLDTDTEVAGNINRSRKKRSQMHGKRSTLKRKKAVMVWREEKSIKPSMSIKGGTGSNNG